MLPSKARINGYVRRGDRRVPPPGKLTAWDAGVDSAHVTCENGARDTFPAAQKVHSVKEREGGFDTGQNSFPPDPHQGHTRDQRLATRDPRTRGLLPASTVVLRRTQPATPDGASRHQSTSRATLIAKHCTGTPTRQPRITRKTRHDTAHDRKADRNTSTAPPGRNSTLGLPWGAWGCTKGDRRGLATDEGVHMNGRDEAERTAEGHWGIPDDGLCM